MYETAMGTFKDAFQQSKLQGRTDRESIWTTF